MKKYLIVISFLILNLSANSLESLVTNALDKNNELKSIEKSILIANENITLATKLSNPILSLGINDIHTNENYDKRDLEAMQAQFIGITQAIPITNKLEINKSIQITNKNILALSLEDKKLLLKAKIYELAYNIAILEEKKRLILEQKRNIGKLEKLQNYLYQTSKTDVKTLFDTKLINKNFDITLNNLQTNITTLKLNLEEIAYTKIDILNINLDVFKASLENNIEKHPKVQAFNEQLKAFKQQEAYEKALKTSDINFNITYFNRTEFQDYVNVSVAIPLSIYNRENINVKKAQYSYLKAKNDLESLRRNFTTTQQILQNELNTSYENYQLLSKEMLALQKSIDKSLKIDNKFKNNSTQIIQNLNKTLKLQIDALDEKSKFFTTLAKSKYYEGNIQ